MSSVILTISGASGVGKSTTAKELLGRKGFSLVPSNTTRKPRVSDLPGEYRYYTDTQFEFIQRGGWFLWRVDVHGIHVGTRKDDLDRALEAKKGASLLLVTPETLRTLLAYVPQEKVCAIYLHVRSQDVLRNRLRERGSEDEATILRRLEDCARWDEEARASDLPFHFVSTDGTKAQTIKNILHILKIRP